MKNPGGDGDDREPIILYFGIICPHILKNEVQELTPLLQKRPDC